MPQGYPNSPDLAILQLKPKFIQSSGDLSPCALLRFRRRHFSNPSLHLSRLLRHEIALGGGSHTADLLLLLLDPRHGSRMAMVAARMLLPRDIKIDGRARVPHGLPALPQREDTDAGQGAEHPEDADHHPAREERLAEHVSARVHGDGPEDQERDGHDDGHALRNDTRPVQLRLLRGELHFSVDSVARHHLEVHVRGFSDVVVVTLADRRHGLPVVVVGA